MPSTGNPKPLHHSITPSLHPTNPAMKTSAITKLLDQLDHRAANLELEAVAKRHALKESVKARGIAAAEEARVCRERIQNIVARLHA